MADEITNETFDVFLSFNSEDREIVRSIAEHLYDNAQLKPWFDEWNPIPGESAIQNLERGLIAAKTCAAFIGESGQGPWQKPEVEVALRRQIGNASFRVIPVFLPGAPQKPELPPFLANNTWVDMRGGLEDDNALWQLECGIRGVSPGRGRNFSTLISQTSNGVLLDQLEAESRARCVMRWCALGVTRNEALMLYADPNVGKFSPDIAPTLENPVRVIQATLGTGKSLFGERLHQQGIERFRHEQNAPIPIYMESRPALGELRDAISIKCIGLGLPAKQGVSVVIDDQLSAGNSTVLQLLDEVRYLAALWPQTYITILSRPMPDTNALPEFVSLPNLSEAETNALIQQLGGRIPYKLPSSLYEAISRPLFAILFAVSTRRDSKLSPHTIGELLDDLVRHALQRATSQWNEESVFQNALEKLAISILLRGGAVPAVETMASSNVNPLLASGLVIHERGNLRFSLDILLEWFATQALHKQKITPQQLIDDERLLERWFYPLVMFVNSASHEQVTAFLTPIARQYPTTVLQIVTEGLKSNGRRGIFEQDETQPPPYAESGRRLREAMLTWVNSLGPLARLIAPVDDRGALLPLGVAVGRGVYLRSWYEGNETLPPVVELPAQLVESSPFSPANRNFPNWEWRNCKWDKVGFSPAWAWEATLDELKKNLAELIRVQGFPINKGKLYGGPLWKETAWLAAVWVMNYGSAYDKPLPLDELQKKLGRWSDDEIISRFGNRPVPLAPLRAEVTRLLSEGETEFIPLYPGPDEYSPNGWWRDSVTGEKHRPEEFISVGSSRWDNFSNERLAVHVAAVYEAALIGYEQIVYEWLPALAPRLKTAALFPVKIVGMVEHPWPRIGITPGVSWHFEPLPLNSDNSVEMKALQFDGENNSFPNEQLVSLMQLYAQMRPHASRWLGATLMRQIFSSGEGRPATTLTYEWLKNDLKHAGWI